MTASAQWTGPGKDLRGLVSGWLTVEAAAPSDGVHLRALCRCRCGRPAVRRIVALRSGEARACVHCKDAERAERASLAAEHGRLGTPERHRQSAEDVSREAAAEVVNARRRARYVPPVIARGPCTVPGCLAPIGRGRRRYCDEHGAAARGSHAPVEGRVRHYPRAGDPGWDEVRERAKQRRRERRVNDRAFRVLEARLAREYRARKREQSKAA